MRDKFRGYYRPTKDEFQQMWKNGSFVLDTNVLLNLYRYSNDTRDQLLKILREVKERVWLPHQVAQEYMKRRLGEIHSQNKKLQNLRALLEETVETVERELNNLHRDPGIEVQNLLDEVRQTFRKLSDYASELESKSMNESNSPEGDEMWAAIEEIVADRIGEPYSQERQNEILEEGEKRYDEQIPPGYKDASKDGAVQFGDLILWLQTVDKAKEIGKPIILITADRKEDWWWISHGKTIGPRPELVDEIYREAGVSFYTYTPEHFMKYAKTYLNQEVSDEAIGEVQELGDREEAEMTLGEIQQKLDAAAEALTADEEQIIDLHYYEGLSRREIAEKLGLSMQRVAQILREALGKLSEEIDSEAEENRRDQTRSESPKVSVPRGAFNALPAITAAREFAKVRNQLPQGFSKEQMRMLREAAEHLPSERDMKIMRDAARQWEQWRKHLK